MYIYIFIPQNLKLKKEQKRLPMPHFILLPQILHTQSFQYLRIKFIGTLIILFNEDWSRTHLQLTISVLTD